MTKRFFSPVGQLSLYAGCVAMRAIRNAGLLYGVRPPSSKRNAFAGSFGSHCTTSGGKNTGAAVLARTSCQSGICVLRSGRSGALYFAYGLVLMGHGESVETLRVTTSNRHLSLSESSIVSAPKTSLSFSVSGTLL